MKLFNRTKQPTQPQITINPELSKLQIGRRDLNVDYLKEYCQLNNIMVNHTDSNFNTRTNWNKAYLIYCTDIYTVLINGIKNNEVVTVVNLGNC